MCPRLLGGGLIPQMIRGAAAYKNKVLGYSPIAYWMLAEAAGATAIDEVNSPAQDGTYGRDVSVMGTGGGIGDGNTAPLFDGTNDFVNCFSATLAAAFSGVEGSLMLWARVSAVGVWTDAANRYGFRLLADADNYMQTLKPNVNNRWNWAYAAGATLESNNNEPLSTTAWFPIGIAWSAAGDTVDYYINGVPAGAQDTVLGAWVGAPAADFPIIGAGSNAPFGPFDGWLAHVALWDTALSTATFADLAVV